MGGKATDRISCYVNEPPFIIDHPSNIGQHSAKIRSEETRKSSIQLAPETIEKRKYHRAARAKSAEVHFGALTKTLS